MYSKGKDALKPLVFALIENLTPKEHELVFYDERIEKLPDDVCNIDIDLKKVDYIASAGLRVLVAANKLMAKRGGSIRLLNLCDEVWSVFGMTGLSEVFVIEQRQ